MLVEKKLAAMGLILPEPVAPVANYETAVLDRGVLYCSGTTCMENGNPRYRGRVGEDVTLERTISP